MRDATSPDARAATAAVARPGAGVALWMLRINPLRRRRLADPTLRVLLGELDAAEQDVRSAAERCSAELYEWIGSTDDHELRGRLIAWRRAIHNDRELRGQPAPDTPAVADWSRARARRSAATDRITGEFAAAADRERATLAALLADDDLRCSLALVAPEVYAAAERYRAAVTDGAVSARIRKSERGLVQYLARAMVRTSPLSRFTAVGLAVPDDEHGVAPDAVRFDGAVAFPGLDRVLLHYVLDGVNGPAGVDRADADPAPTDWVRLPPTARVDLPGNRLYFLRAADGGIRRLATGLTEAVRLLLDATAMGPRRVAAVTADITLRTGCSPDDASAAVAGAVRASILCTCSGPEDGAADVRALLAGCPDPAVAGLLDEVGTRLPLLAVTPAERRHTELTRLRTALTDLSQRARRPAQVLVEEEYVVPPVSVSTRDWRSQLDDVAAAVELLSVFDRLHDVRALLSAAFVRRFGTGATVRLVEHAGELAEEVYRTGGGYDGPRPGAGPADGSLDRLHALRQRVVEVAQADLCTAQERGEEVRWTATDVRALTADLPDRFRADPLEYGALVQPWRGRLVFNDAYAGHGMLYGRFLGADRDLGGRALPLLADRLRRRYGGDGIRLVEDIGLHRLNVNAHVPVLADRLGPDDWFTLLLAHDADTDTVRVCDPDGRHVRVLTLGSGFPELFPYPLRIATWLVSGGRLFTDLVGHWYRSSGAGERQTVPCPRVSVGSAVLTRRRWYGNAELAEALAVGPAEHDRLLALTAWRARHGVPEEVVLKTALDDQYQQSTHGPDTDMQSYLRRQKPQYVDLASALNARVLPRLADRRGGGYLEEALPAVGDGAHAVEWVVPIGRTAGRPFCYEGGTPCV